MRGRWTLEHGVSKAWCLARAVLESLEAPELAHGFHGSSGGGGEFSRSLLDENVESSAELFGINFAAAAILRTKQRLLVCLAIFMPVPAVDSVTRDGSFKTAGGQSIRFCFTINCSRNINCGEINFICSCDVAVFTLVTHNGSSTE
jgi:hypothetical protein